MASLTLSLTLSIAIFSAFSLPMAKAVLYMFAVKATYINLEGALSYYYTSGSFLTLSLSLSCFVAEVYEKTFLSHPTLMHTAQTQLFTSLYF